MLVNASTGGGQGGPRGVNKPQNPVISLPRRDRLCKVHPASYNRAGGPRWRGTANAGRAQMTSPGQDYSALAERGASRPSVRRLLPLIAIVLVSGLALAMGWHQALSFETLARHHAVIHGFVARHEAAAVATYVGIYITVVALSVPGAVFLTLAGGMLFGPVLGAAAAVVGATIGAICIFLIARSALGEYLVRRAGPRAERLAQGFRADAFNYLLFLRLVPVFPFWLVNLVPVLAGIQLSTFAAATVLGVIPATLVFAFLGSSLGNVVAADVAAYQACLAAQRPDCRFDFDANAGASLELLGALALLGILALAPVVLKRLQARSRATRPSG